MAEINGKEPVVTLEKVPNKFYGSIKKFWKRTFVAYEIWWWLITLGVFTWAMFFSLRYLPIIRPDTFRDQNNESSLEKLQNLTVFFPPRAVPYHEYDLAFSFHIPDDLPEGTEKVTFLLNTDLPGAKLDPPIIEYNVNQSGWIIQQVKLQVLESKNRHEKISINVKSPQLNAEQAFDIAIVNRSYSIGLMVAFIITYGAIILKVLAPIFNRIGQAIKQRFDSAPNKTTS